MCKILECPYLKSCSEEICLIQDKSCYTECDFYKLFKMNVEQLLTIRKLISAETGNEELKIELRKKNGRINRLEHQLRKIKATLNYTSRELRNTKKDYEKLKEVLV